MMTQRELLKYCFYYKGEALVPPRFNKDEGALWQAEKFVCESLQDAIDPAHPRLSVARYVAAYISKWLPYTFGRVMELYFTNAPEIKGDILGTNN